MYMLARTGRWLGGNTPIGFGSEKIEHADAAGKTRTAYKLIPLEEEQELVKFIYQKFIEMQSISGTMRYLVQNNIRTRKGKDFTNIAVKDILRNPVYCNAGALADEYFASMDATICYEDNELDNKHGFMPYNRTSNGKTQQVRNEISDWMIAIGKHEGIIQADIWVKIQRTLDAKRHKNRSTVRTPYKSEALLSGLLMCEKCGSAMRPHVHTSRKTADGRVPYYYLCELKERSSRKRCTMDNANGPIIDKVIMDELLRFDQDDSMVSKSLLQLSSHLASKKESELEHQGYLQSVYDTTQGQIDDLTNALARGAGRNNTAFEEIIQKMDELIEQRKRLKMEIEKAALNNTIYTDYQSQTEAVKKSLRQFRDIILTASTVEKRDLLKSTIERIVWDGDKAHIFLLGE
jgi:site-specific DNA recombinase